MFIVVATAFTFAPVGELAMNTSEFVYSVYAKYYIIQGVSQLVITGLIIVLFLLVMSSAGKKYKKYEIDKEEDHWDTDDKYFFPFLVYSVILLLLGVGLVIALVYLPNSLQMVFAYDYFIIQDIISTVKQ